VTPLDLRVVEVASFVAAPSATLTLGQLGAEVVRVDPPGGAADRTRWPVAPSGDSLYWSALNRGKRSVVVDVRRPEGRELVVDLVAAGGPRGGVLVDNLAGARWLDTAALRERRPDVVHARLLGRPDGRPSLDYTANAAVGVPAMTGPSGDGPTNHVLPAWDLLTGQYLVVAVLAALLRRSATGEGSDLVVSLDDVAMTGVANLGWAAHADLTGTDRGRDGNHLHGAYGTDLGTADGRRVMVVALGERQWRRLCAATGTGPAFAALADGLDLDLGDDAARYGARELVTAVLRPWFAARTVAEVGERLDEHGVLWGPYRTTTEAVARELAADRADPLLRHVHQHGVGPMVVAGFPVRGLGRDDDHDAAPRLGADTEPVLADVLGLSAAEIGRLLADGVVATHAVDAAR
jgi:2-methylfumaryl-CoA isomerase